MDCLPVFQITFFIKTSQTVTIFEIIKNLIPEILRPEIVSYIAPKIWSKVPRSIKMNLFLESFKPKICK